MNEKYDINKRRLPVIESLLLFILKDFI